MFLILVGPEKAKEIVKTFSEEELLKITGEILQIESISDDEIKEVEKNFGVVRTGNVPLRGGKEFARNLLQNAFGIEKGSNFFIKTVEESKEKDFEFLEKLTPEQINTIITDESDIVISVILGMIDPKKSAKILGLLPREMSINVIKKMSGKLEINKDVLEIVLKKLKEKAHELTDENTLKISGKNKLVEILKYADSEQSDKILSDISEDDPELAEEIKDNIFTFNDIALLTKKDMEKVLKNYLDKEIAFILKGASEEIKTIFFTCVTKRRKDIIEEEMQILGTVKKKDVDGKRKDFIKYLKDLEAKGSISLKPDKDIYIK